MSNFDLAQNPNTPPKTLDSLSNDDDYGVRWHVVWNPSTLPETLARLANDKDYDIRRNVARNPNTPQYILTYFKIKKFLTHYNCFNHE